MRTRKIYFCGEISESNFWWKKVPYLELCIKLKICYFPVPTTQIDVGKEVSFSINIFFIGKGSFILLGSLHPCQLSFLSSAAK